MKSELSKDEIETLLDDAEDAFPDSDFVASVRSIFDRAAKIGARLALNRLQLLAADPRHRDKSLKALCVLCEEVVTGESPVPLPLPPS